MQMRASAFFRQHNAEVTPSILEGDGSEVRLDAGFVGATSNLEGP
jgi:hypothetical protein